LRVSPSLGQLTIDNDTQYGNLLLLDQALPQGMPDHHRYIVIDFEYAAPNPRGYDIANHFHEWRADYHHPTHAHSLRPHFPYPSPEQREEFYRAYLSVAMDASNGQEIMGKRADVAADRVAALEREVRIWSPACSVFWALWGIVQAEEQIGALIDEREGYEAEFDYLVSMGESELTIVVRFGEVGNVPNRGYRAGCSMIYQVGFMQHTRHSLYLSPKRRRLRPLTE
jgi:choline kinase